MVELTGTRLVRHGPWIFVLGDVSKLATNIGKWMYFFKDKEFVAKICREAVSRGIVAVAKYTNAEAGVACFYLKQQDLEGHRRVIAYMLEKGLIQRTSFGRLYDISFKLDEQTKAGMYGEQFCAETKLSDFMNLSTGEWLV